MTDLRLPRKVEIAIVVALVAFSLFFALSNLMDKPVTWFDEGITIEIARNFSLFGELDILTAPETFSEVPYLVGTNGFPLTLPLALVFKIFGIGLLQARIYMLFWLLATLGVLYFATRRILGIPAAISALAFLVTFSSFYGNGLTATGEMPGLFFFILGTWFLVERKSYFFTGIMWGLAMAAKPGVFLLLAHTTVLYILITDHKEWIRKIFRAGLGFVIPVVIWILLAFPLTSATFYSVLTYALNPIDIPIVTNFLEKYSDQSFNHNLVVPNIDSPKTNLVNNLMLFGTHTTMIYFSMLFLIAVVAFPWRRQGGERKKKLIFVLLIYGALTLFYFVRGPGWLRYLIGLQVFIFIMLYPAIENAAEMFLSRIRKTNLLKNKLAFLQTHHLVLLSVLLLFVFQMTHLYRFSNIPDSKGAREFTSELLKKMEADPKLSVGLYNVPEVAAFTDPERTYHIVLPQHGIPPLGESPLLMKVTPQVIVVNNEDLLIGEKEQAILDQSYVRRAQIRKFHVYDKKAPLR